MLLKLSKFFLYASVFAVVIVLTGTFFPFIGGKYYFFRVTTELALACLILWWAFEAPEGAFANIVGVWKKPLVVAVSIFVLAFLLASAFAFDPHAAFWSNYERGEGGFQMIHYYILFMLLLLVLRSEKDWRWMFGASIVAAGCMVFYGVFSAAYAAPIGLPWPLNIFFIGPYPQGGAQAGSTFLSRLFSNDRFQGSLGNPAYVAPYLMFSMFYVLWLWLARKSKNVWRTVIYVGLTLFFLIFFVLPDTRGAFLGFIVSVYLFLVYVGFQEPRYRKISLGILALLTMFGSILVHFRTSQFVRTFPGGRLFDLPLSDSALIAVGVVAFLIAVFVVFASEKKVLWWAVAGIAMLCLVGGVAVKSTGYFPGFADQTTDTRFWTWGSAWHGFLDSPKTVVFGWGPENFTAVFDKYFNPKHFVPGTNSETWFDRAHSVIFDYLAETGLVGLLSYLGMFIVFYWEFIRRTCKKGSAAGEWSRANALLNGLLFAVPIGYLVQGLALFDVLPIYINVFIFLAFASFLFYFSPDRDGHPVIRVRASQK